jgi:hypothetical protein
MENRMITFDNKVFTRVSRHWYLQVVFAVFLPVKECFFFSYINYSLDFEKCQVKFLFFLKKFLIKKRRAV